MDYKNGVQTPPTKKQMATDIFAIILIFAGILIIMGIATHADFAACMKGMC